MPSANQIRQRWYQTLSKPQNISYVPWISLSIPSLGFPRFFRGSLWFGSLWLPSFGDAFVAPGTSVTPNDRGCSGGRLHAPEAGKEVLLGRWCWECRQVGWYEFMKAVLNLKLKNFARTSREFIDTSILVMATKSLWISVFLDLG